MSGPSLGGGNLTAVNGSPAVQSPASAPQPAPAPVSLLRRRNDEMQRWLARAARQAWSKPAGVAMVFGLLLAAGYGWTRAMSALYYGSLGVSPEAVGLSYPTALAQSAFGLFALFLVGAVAYSALAGLLWGVGRLLPSRDRIFTWVDASRRRKVAGAAFVLAALAAATWELISTPPHTGPLIVLGVLGMVVGPVVVRSEFEKAGFWRVARNLALLGVAAAIVGSVVVARTTALDALDHGAGDPTFISVLFPWTTRPAVVSWRGAPLDGVSGRCALYLGESSTGPLVLGSDAQGHRRTLVVPPADGSVAIVPSAYGCTFPPLKSG